MIGRMSAVKGRQRRVKEERKPLFAKVSESHHAKASCAAQRMGISLAAYIDLLLEREQVDDSGRPLWAPEQRLTFEELREVS